MWGHVPRKAVYDTVTVHSSARAPAARQTRAGHQGGGLCRGGLESCHEPGTCFVSLFWSAVSRDVCEHPGWTSAFRPGGGEVTEWGQVLVW